MITYRHTSVAAISLVYFFQRSWADKQYHRHRQNAVKFLEESRSDTPLCGTVTTELTGCAVKISQQQLHSVYGSCSAYELENNMKNASLRLIFPGPQERECYGGLIWETRWSHEWK